jgi:hypothetical protein
MNAIWHLRFGDLADRLRSNAARQPATERLFRGVMRKMDAAPLHASRHQRSIGILDDETQNSVYFLLLPRAFCTGYFCALTPNLSAAAVARSI